MQDHRTIPAVFGDLDQSAASAHGQGARDRLILKDYVLEAEIGAFQQERGIRQRLRFSIVAELAERAASDGDDVDRILSYDRLIEAVDRELSGERLDLLETLAERIAARVLSTPQAARVHVRIEKLDRGPWVLGVEIARERHDLPAVSDAPARRPVIAYFQGPVADLARRMQKLVSLDLPVVIVPGLPDIPRPKAVDPAAQFRIDLLAIEQAAWSLAARDPRLAVVSSRTEMNWAIAQGRIIVWAPVKMATDTAGAPRQIGQELDLALWLADQIAAQQVVVHATVAGQAESRVPIAVL